MNPDPHSSHYAYKLEGRIDSLESKVELLICEVKALRKQQSCIGLASPRDYWLLRENDSKPWKVLDWEPNISILCPSGWQMKRVREVWHVGEI